VRESEPFDSEHYPCPRLPFNLLRSKIVAMVRSLAIIVVLACASIAVAGQATAPKPTEPSADQQNAQPAAVQEAQPPGTANPGDAQQDVPDSQDPKAAQQPDSKSNDSDQQKPGTFKRLKRHLRNQVSSGCVNAVGNHCWDKPPADDDGSGKDKNNTQETAANNPPPRSDRGESSSRSTKIDLSPPPGEAAPPGVGVDTSTADVREFKPWDPHKADKNVEVGDFYFKRGNFRAAESRYKEALYWKDDDAIAIFRMAQAQEKLGKFADARKNYTGYLKILPKGEFAAEANKGLERLKDKSDQPIASARP
jgi:tetratricopeptide (TPR) repeat protein